MSNNNKIAALYVVATPIGNLADISLRALEILKQVDLILAEDTRHSKKLLAHYGIGTSLKSCHQHNEHQASAQALELLQQGKSIALISDAGTPLISDPGYLLVSACREHGFELIPIPGASSIIAALSVAGLPTNRFSFEGFLPAKSSARLTALQQMPRDGRTLVLLESSHRILACVNDIAEVFPSQTEVVVARELTKRYESIVAGSPAEVAARIAGDSDQQKGEFVIMLHAPALDNSGAVEVNSEQLLQALLAQVSVKQAAAIAADITGERKNALYQQALALSKSRERE